jgi:hypothetical protein
MPTSLHKSYTDVNDPGIKLYIEGIQVPFINMSISSSLGNLPQASINVLPHVGLMEVGKFYNPKVHVFFTDPVDGEDKLLFSGLIASSSASRSADGSSSISFNCIHRYQLMDQVLLDYSSWTERPDNPNQSDGAIKLNTLNSKWMTQTALTGIYRNDSDNAGKREVSLENIQDDIKNNAQTTSPAVVPTFLQQFKHRVIGIPGVLVNVWNQIKHGAFSVKDVSDQMINMYIPLMEIGLQFFQRMSGHFFIENLLEEDRIDPCLDPASPELTNKPKLVSPGCRVFLRSAIQTNISEELMFSLMQNSGELTTIMDTFQNILRSMDYEMLVLNSPAETPKDARIDSRGAFLDSSNTFATDVIIKPQLPFYFSPLCNVVYPSMVRNLQITQNDYSIPTRITLRNIIKVLGEGITDQHFRSPPSVREAIASAAATTKKKVPSGTKEEPVPGMRTTSTTGVESNTTQTVKDQNLVNTFNLSFGKIGKFEQGTGIKHEKMNMPQWIMYLAKSQKLNESKQLETTNELDVAAINALKVGWERRYGSENLKLNPWDPASGLSAYQRLLVASADYYYARAVAGSRVGQVETIFNPYIVVGYPMDILDSTPNQASYHSYCTSVTHNISSSSISTVVSFTSAMTYTELANYYTAPVHPWLLNALGLAESQSIVDYKAGETTDVVSTGVEPGNEDVNNPSASELANRFYKTTVGVGAAKPLEIYNFNTGLVKAVKREGEALLPGSEASQKTANQGEINPNLSGIGNLSLVYRNIESKEKVQERWGVNFIDLKPGLYNRNAVKINSKVLADRDKLEMGQSIWLDYEDINAAGADPQKGFQAEVRAIDQLIDDSQKT